MAYLNFFKKLFKPSEKLNMLVSDINNQKQAVDHFIQNNNLLSNKYCSLKDGKCCSTEVLYWEKNEKHQYVKANGVHCNVFFDISFNDIDSIIGKTDVDMIVKYRASGKQHTFGELCISTDEYMKENLKRCRFFEFGYKEGQPLLLDITKTAIVDENNNFKGTKGYAINLSHNENDVVTLLNIFLEKGIAVRLDNKNPDNKVASYLIKENHKAFNGMFPS